MKYLEEERGLQLWNPQCFNRLAQRVERRKFVLFFALNE